eukprot:12135835-Heterocapsa_arctica.AAC.1
MARAEGVLEDEEAFFPDAEPPPPSYEPAPAPSGGAGAGSSGDPPVMAAVELPAASLCGPVIFLASELLNQVVARTRPARPAPASPWTRHGPLLVCVMLAVAGTMAFPLVSDAAPYRLMFAVLPGGLRLVQHCVDARFEEVSALDVQFLEPAARLLVTISSDHWLVFDDQLQFQRGAPTGAPPCAPAWPLIGATHRHRFVRGQAKIDGRWVTLARFSGAYTAEWSATFGRLYANAIGRVTRSKAGVPTAFSARAAEVDQTTAEQLIAAVRVRGKQPAIGDEAAAPLPAMPSRLDDHVDPELIAEGRASEEVLIAERERIGDAVREADPFAVVASMRAAIVSDQWKDSALLLVIQRFTRAGAGCPGVDLGGTLYRVSDDRCLEAAVDMPGKGAAHWVPVAPAGGPQPQLSWRAFFFQHCHVGPFGGHKNAAQTAEMLQRLVYWQHVVRDVERWVDRCWTCVQYRRRCSKVQASFIVATTFLPWQEVMVDVEGPSCPPDRDGWCYVLTYSDLLCGGSLLEPI